MNAYSLLIDSISPPLALPEVDPAIYKNLRKELTA